MIRKRGKRSAPNIAVRAAFLLLLAGVCGNILFLQKPYAAETGTAYLATAHPYYAHPVTGEVEDAGNNAGIGQAMTESVLNTTALIEKAESGTTYATVRLSLMDNISDVRFATQERGASGWTEVSSEIMQENTGDSYTSDFRFCIPSESGVIRIQLYVTAMGRDVIFYADFSDLQEGSGDFIVSVDASGVPAANETTPSAAADSVQTTKEDASVTALDSAEELSEESTEDATENAAKNNQKTGSQLIAEADGMVLSDESILENTETEASFEGGDEAANAGTDVIPALSWKLVLQCVILLTVPGIVVGSVLLLLRTRLQKRERVDE